MLLTPRRLLVPAEHGTWGQALFPLLTALLLGQARSGALALSGAVVCGYLASEGIQTLAGWRGARARREWHVEAVWSVLVFGLGAFAGGLWAMTSLSQAPLLAALMAAVLAAAVWTLAARGRLRTSAGEVLVSAALSAWAVPVALACGVPPGTAVAVWVVWSAAFGGATLAVRSLIARQTRRRAAPSRWGALGVTACALVLLAVLARREAVPGLVFFGFLPTALATTAICWAPISARRLRWVGWSLLVSGLLLFAAWVGAGV